MSINFGLARRETATLCLPAMIAGAGERAEWRFAEFFTANIRNANTRAAYGRAAGAFLRLAGAERSSALERAILGLVTPTHKLHFARGRLELLTNRTYRRAKIFESDRLA
jgi:hypothetical protein